MSSTQFMDMRAKVDKNERRVTKSDWYAAQVAAAVHNLHVELRRMFDKTCKLKYVTVGDCLVKWTESEVSQVSKVDQAVERDELTAHEVSARERAVWGAWLGMTPESYDGGVK